MKRREFIVGSMGLAGSLVPMIVRGQSSPCPPPSLGVAGGTSTATACGAAVTGPAPNWFLNMPESTWIEVAAGQSRTDLQVWQRGQRLTDVDIGSGPWGSSLDAILRDYTGGAVDQDLGELIVGNAGGHASRQGNDMYACRIRQESPGWVRLSNPSSRVGTTGSVDSALSDQTPKAPHGWGRAVWANGRVWWPTMDAYWPDNATADCWSFNRAALVGRTQPVDAASGVWALHGLTTNNPPDGSGLKFAGAGTTYDKVANRIWTLANFDVYGQNVFAIDASYTGTRLIADNKVQAYDGHPSGSLSFGGKWVVCASDKRVLIAMTAPDSYFDAPNTICVLDLNNPAAGWIRKGLGSGTPDTGEGRGAVYHAPTSSIYLWDEGFGSRPKRLTVPTSPLSSSSSDWVWSSVSPAQGSTVTPSNPSENAGTYGKFNIIEDMGNRQSALVLVNRIAEPVYVFKLPK